MELNKSAKWLFISDWEILCQENTWNIGNLPTEYQDDPKEIFSQLVGEPVSLSEEISIHHMQKYIIQSGGIGNNICVDDVIFVIMLLRNAEC